MADPEKWIGEERAMDRALTGVLVSAIRQAESRVKCPEADSLQFQWVEGTGQGKLRGWLVPCQEDVCDLCY